MFPLMTYSVNTYNEASNMDNSRERLNEIRDEFRATTPPSFPNEVFQYTRIAGNSSPSVDSKVDYEILRPPPVTPTENTRRISDQKLPSGTKCNSKSPAAQSVKSFVYVNKNGYAKLIQAELNEDKQANKTTVGLNTSHENHSVPMANLNQSLSSTSSTFIQTNINGQLQINTSAMVNDEYVDIKYEHVKYLGLMAILCCWCFPFTGIPALVYSYLMKKFYGINDMIRAKSYMVKSERCVLLTFFFGFTLIAILFAILQVYFFNTKINETQEAAAIDYRAPHYRPFIPH